MAVLNDTADGHHPAHPRRAHRWLACCVTALVAAGCADDPVRPADEAPKDSVPVYEYGVKFEPPAGRIVHGLGQWDACNATYRAMLPASARPASELVFIPIGDTPRGWNASSTAAGTATTRGTIRERSARS